jgi:hypothetical protein
MKNDNFILNQDRRQFISTIIPACALSCSALKNLTAVVQSDVIFKEKSKKHKFQKKWGHTYEEAFRWRYGFYIEIMEEFSKYLGRKQLIEMIMRAVDDSNPISENIDPNFSFIQWIKGGSIFQNMMTWEIIEQSEKAYEIKVSECLWAKTFQDRNAADIGYATVCYSDFSAAKATHPKITLERTKTIMQGHGYCNHRWKWEG